MKVLQELVFRTGVGLAISAWPLPCTLSLSPQTHAPRAQADARHRESLLRDWSTFYFGISFGQKKRGLERPRPFFVCMIPLYLVEKGKPANFAKIYSAYLQ